MLEINHKKLCENCFAQIEKEPCPKCGFYQNGCVKDPMTLSPGSILENRYVIGRVIGKGGFGTTYLAYDKKLECRVAVKEYYPYGLAVRSPGTTAVSVSNAEAEETFRNGAEKFYDEARLVAQSVSNALMAAHSLNVLHRDISPDNIMVCKDGTIKLLDFGAARQIVTEGSQSLSVILKQGFAPLEQYQKKGKQGPWTDIYSLGATLYHALTLDVLDDPMSRFGEDEEYSSNKHQIMDELWRMIKKATALRMQDRYQDIFEWKKDLNVLSIKTEALVEADIEEGRKFRTTEKVFESTGHTAPAVGMTVPLPEEEVGVGVTLPLPEEEPIGVTVPLRGEETQKQDSDSKTEEEGKTERKKQSGKKKWIVGLQQFNEFGCERL